MREGTRGTDNPPPEIHIREMCLADAEGITAVLNPIIRKGGATVLASPFTVDEELAFLAAFPKRGIFHVAVVDDCIRGFQVCEPFGPFSTAFDHVATIGTYVDLGSHHRGIGKRLAQATFVKAKQRGFEKFLTYVIADNDPALRFYAGLGFEIIGVAKRQAKLNGVYHDEVLIEKQLL